MECVILRSDVDNRGYFRGFCMQKGVSCKQHKFSSLMQSNLLSLWRTRAVAISLALIGAGAYFFMASPAFAAAPTGFTSQTYSDANGDGTVETVTIVVNGSEALTTCTVTAASGEIATDWTYTGNSIGGSISEGSCVTATATITFTLTGTNANTTSHTTAPTIAYDNDDADASVRNATGILGTVAAQNITDGAKPIFLTAVTGDNNADGTVDRLVMTFSESVVITDGGSDDDITLVASSGTATVAEGVYAATASTLTYTISASATGNTAITVNPTYVVLGAGSIKDVSTNEMLNGETVTGTDGAGPVLMSSTPDSGDVNVSITSTVVMLFSEAINTGSFTWSHLSGGPASTAFTSAWTVGNTTLTLTATGNLSSGYHSVDVTAAPDTATNAFAGANTATADPIIFTVRSTSESTSSATTEATYEIDVTSPNGGEELAPGDLATITWTSDSSNGSLSFVNINLMYEMDGSTVQETIVEGTSNDGSYTWTVPNIESSEVKIQVVGTDLVDALVTDESDDYFSVTSEEEATDAEDEDSDDVVPSTGETGLSPVTGEEEEISDVEAGMYVRSVYFDTVYYIDEIDGELVRRPFTDAQTYFTYQNSWSSVETVTDATLPTLSLGSPMLPKAGVVLVKVQSDARTYALEEVDGEVFLRWITSESAAQSLFGSDWADYVIDVSATLFPRFEQGDDVDSADDYDADADAMKTREEVNS